jgi:hypothetical protein
VLSGSVDELSTSVSGSCPSQSLPSADHMATSVAHVAHYIFALACAGGKNWFIVEFVLAICSVFLGLPGFLPVLT